MSRELFGTDGVRGLANEYPLNEDGATRIGRAIGTYFAKPGETIVLGRDPRQSSDDIAAWVTAGLNAVGVNVVSAGVLPTPGLAYSTREGDFAAGVMITASHNPYNYNGVKAFDKNGDKLPDTTEETLNELIEQDIPDVDTPGDVREDVELVKKYEDFLVSTVEGLQISDLKLAIDSANGAASGIAERVMSRLGAEVTAMFDSPDGININDHCGAIDTKALQKEVTEKHLSLGIALDGDADRLVMVDGEGREVNGDHIMYILAVSRNVEGVVSTTMSNLGLENSLTAKGIKLIRTSVGDRYVLHGLQSHGYRLGGEQSGHLIIYDVLRTGDALLGAVQVLKALQESGKSLAQWRDEVQLLPQALINIPLDDKNLLQDPKVLAYVEEQTAKLGDSGRLLIRPSGTEPLARIMVEAPDAEAIIQEIVDGLNMALGEAKNG